MSYQTSPILNRIKILKGWKHPNFPAKTLNYSREIILWFKVYLFLKVYLWCQNIRLLTCEVRTSEIHKKILYLSISKHLPKKKKVKSKWKTKSFLQNLKSPFVKTQNKKARFLLYRDLRTLKQKSEFFFNTQRKKKISKTWISKSRQSSWINFSDLLYRRRFFQRQQQVLSFKKKQNLRFSKDFSKDHHQTSKKSFVIALQKKTKFFAPILEERQNLLKKKQKNFLGLIRKLQKDLLFLEKILDQLSIQNLNFSQKSFHQLNQQLTTEYQNKILLLEKIEKLCFEEEENKNEEESSLSFCTNSFATTLFQQKINKQWTNFYFFLKKQWAVYQKKLFFHFSRKKKFFLLNEELFWKNYFWHFLTSTVRNIAVPESQNEAFLFMEKNNFLFSRHLHAIFLFSKILSFKKPAQLRQYQVFKFLRFAQQIPLDEEEKIEEDDLDELEKLEDETVPEKIIKSETQKLEYRLSVRYNYRNYLTLTSHLKLKYLISDLIQKYFSVFLDVKLIWPLKQFKNLKFYRLMFPVYKKRQPLALGDKMPPWEVDSWQKKKYFYVGQNTNHLKIREHVFFSNQKMDLYKELYFQDALLNPASFEKRLLYMVNKESIKPISKNLSGVWQKKLKKKNKYLIFKKKVIQSQSEKRLSWASKQKYISNLTVTLTLFAKYLEVQPLADHLAKIIGETKKHSDILKIIKNVLRTIRFKRGIGYRIALTGRINGSKKSRTFYLKKLNRNRSRQTFSKNVNFALAHAKATIGTFGVRVWVYF